MLKRFAVWLLFVGVSFFPQDVFSQCAMCKAANEDNASTAEGFNAAILFLMSVPYLIGLVAVVFFVVYWRKRKKLLNQ